MVGRVGATDGRLEQELAREGRLLVHGLARSDAHAEAAGALRAGRGGGATRPGRHLHYAGDRPLADLWLTVLRGSGATADRFADSTGVLTELAG